MFLFCDYIITSSLRYDARCWSDWVHTMVKLFKLSSSNVWTES